MPWMKSSGVVGMIEPGEGQRFLAEALAGPFVREAARRQDFQGDLALETLIARPINHAHPAGAGLLENTVVRECPAFHRPGSLDFERADAPRG